MLLNQRITSQSVSSVETGLQASRNGNIQLDCRMLELDIEQIDAQSPELQKPLLELMADLADSYLREGKLESAKNWYIKALYRSEAAYGASSPCAIKAIARLAEISVLQEDVNEFNQYFESLQRAYLLCSDRDLSGALNALIDLSWALCLDANMPAVQVTNTMISHLKQLEEEERLGVTAA